MCLKQLLLPSVSIAKFLLHPALLQVAHLKQLLVDAAGRPARAMTLVVRGRRLQDLVRCLCRDLLPLPRPSAFAAAWWHSTRCNHGSAKCFHASAAAVCMEAHCVLPAGM